MILNITGKGGFVKGQVANPKGRPKGARNKINIAIFDELLKTT